MGLSESLRELRELGARGAAFRALWEVRTRSLLPLRARLPEPSGRAHPLASRPWPFDASGVASVMQDRISPEALEELAAIATRDAEGKVLCFSHWEADFGSPIRWFVDPMTGASWDPSVPWSRALEQTADGRDPKLTWEAARFPQAYRIARASTFTRSLALHVGPFLRSQMEGFTYLCPPAMGIHWASGQEIAIRLLSWLFAIETMGLALGDGARELFAGAIVSGARHIETTIPYAEHAVYNNHLITEALGLYLAGCLVPTHKRAAIWRERGRSLLSAQAERQFYGDGGYINQSFTYQRTASQLLVWACVVARAEGDSVPEPVVAALTRSLDFLYAHQNEDGSLPNFGANDGSLPSVLATTRYPDFRPICQTLSILCRGERLYPPGPWDEEAAWLLGPRALETPLRPRRRTSASFEASGRHVLWGEERGTVASFRCGSMRDRFGQIDMLHVDYSYRGAEIAIDAGSYQYGGPKVWHEHFTRTGCHNTLTVDGRDQMLHHRPFKTLYPTRAKLLSFQGDAVVGEHYGYQRHAGRVVHRRAVALFEPCLAVHDWITGQGTRELILHWLLGPHPFQAVEGLADVTLHTSAGRIRVTVHDETGDIVDGDVVAGADDPPRGWVSRHYADKVPAPSLRVRVRSTLPRRLLTLFRPEAFALENEASGWFLLRDRESCFWLRAESDKLVVEPGALG